MPVHSVDLTPQPAAILRQVNRERMERGAPALELDRQLSAAAQSRAEAVAQADRPLLADNGPGDLARRVQEAGYDQRLVAEIVMQGQEPADVHLDSLRQLEPQTYADAMRMEYRDLGVGLAKGEHGMVCVLIFGLSAVDDFAWKTARLSDRRKVRAEIMERVNAERKTRRLPPLRENALLDKAAQDHADDMIRRSYYSHESPEGTGALERTHRAGYVAAVVGENIAEGQSTAEQVMDAWMASPVHRDHVLSRVLKEIGIGMAFGKNERGYELVWVQVFGQPPPGTVSPPYRNVAPE